MPFYSDLPAFLHTCRDIDWTPLAPRRALPSLSAWQEDWDDGLAVLADFADNGFYGLPLHTLDAYEAHDACMQWQNGCETASTLLRLALERGLPPDGLQALLRQTVALWKDYAAALQHARQFDTVPAYMAIDAERGDQYPYALQLMGLSVLLAAQDEIPAIVDQLLSHQTDRLLDALGATATGILQADSAIFHPDPFDGLTPFFAQEGEIGAAPLLQYLQQAYTEFFALPPKAQKKSRRLIGPQAWGIWAFEVGALVVLHGLDDTALRGNPHYPGELVRYAREAAAG